METWAQTMYTGVSGLWTVFKAMKSKRNCPGEAYKEEGFKLSPGELGVQEVKENKPMEELQKGRKGNVSRRGVY